MNIRFVKHSVKSLSIMFDEDANQSDLGSMTNLQYGPAFPDEEGDEGKYSIIFELTVYTFDQHRIEVEFHAFFETDETIPDNFKKSPFIGVNSPAIAFPYLRAYIGNVCMLSGFEPLVLPTVNFQALYKENNK